jgi:peptidoglycan/LPS O-acetylase OafA/YrhL
VLVDEIRVRDAVASTRTRSLYVDGLRAVAIARVFLHHTLWLGWLTALFPSMWVMFGLAGFLTAGSLDRAGARHTVRSRLRRLLPPLWALAAVAIPLMIVHGWHSDQTSPMVWTDLLWWVLPLANPPASSWGAPFVIALWYIRAYLWFILLSPALWWAFRRWPLPTLVAPLATAVLLSSPLVATPVNEVGDVLWSTACYGTCWVLGFARHTRLLDRMSAWLCAMTAAGLALAGLAWGFAHEGATGAGPFSDPLAETLWATGFVLIVMRVRPNAGWLERVPWVGRTISVVNTRAITIYVWQLPMLFATEELFQLAGVGTLGDAPKVATLAICSLLTTAAVLAFGWVEDLAARRRPTIVPPPIGSPSAAPPPIPPTVLAAPEPTCQAGR